MPALHAKRGSSALRVLTVGPLTFDRVNDGHYITSNAPLFSLPIELIHKILPLLSLNDLGAFAQVDSDCRQLARSAQFAEVTLDSCKTSSWELLRVLELELEAVQRPQIRVSSAIDVCPQPSCSDPASPRRIGPCIRKLNVSHQPLVPSGDLDTSSNKRHGGGFLLRAAQILKGLEHLSSLSWTTTDPSLSYTIVSFLQHPLSLRHLHFSVCPSPYDSLELEDTSFTVSSPIWNLDSFATIIHSSQLPATRSILARIASTIRRLTLIKRRDEDVSVMPCEIYDMPLLESFTLYEMSFPLYREPSMPFHFGSRITELTLTSLTPLSTTEINLNSESEPNPKRRILSLPRLRRFRWTETAHVPEVQSQLLTFLQYNPTIEHLEFLCPLPTPFIDSLISTLHSHTPSLTSLRLIWDAPIVPLTSLKSLGTSLSTSTCTLQHLFLSCGPQNTPFCTWEVDHLGILTALRSFSNSLKTLIFTMDTYPVPIHPLVRTDRERYYLDRLLPAHVSPELFLTSEERWWRAQPCYLLDTSQSSTSTSTSNSDSPPKHPLPIPIPPPQPKLDFDAMRQRERSLTHLAWERWHVARMKGFSDLYFTSFPNLDVCYIGEVMFGRDGGEKDVFEMRREESEACVREFWYGEICGWARE